MFSYQNKKYSIRKVKNGVASVVIALLFSLGGVSKVHAIEQNCGSEDWTQGLLSRCDHGEVELKFEFEKDGGEGSRFHDHLGPLNHGDSLGFEFEKDGGQGPRFHDHLGPLNHGGSLGFEFEKDGGQGPRFHDNLGLPIGGNKYPSAILWSSKSI
ncbi:MULTISPECIES: YSIRK-type signal peptide-containing protein [Streptococcus]|uniref:YSIRK-type signal peptide-containing protein n=1 Tax=Streptococcus caledonicus TaxID=2614158 RepID=A0ABW0UC76_9STRE|nr:YSIRK-type signal peptide-containing protein [Streptococcus sp. S784/96/1]